MGRYAKLESIINKGIVAKENETNILIHNWSPNNIRRLIIGCDKAIIWNHIASTKTLHKSHIEYVSMQKEFKDDITLFQENNDISKLKSLLGVLVTGRICSCIEEIIICSKDYPNQGLFRLDADISVLHKKGGDDLLKNLETRFPRLNNISVVNTNIEKLNDYVTEGVSKYISFSEVLANNGFDVHAIIKLNEEKWIAGSALRPEYYALDDASNLLGKHIKALRDEYFENKNANDKNDKLASVNKDSAIRIFNEHYVKLKALVNWTNELSSLCDEVVNTATIENQLRWGRNLTTELKNRLVIKNIKDGELSGKLKACDINSLVKYLRDTGYDYDFMENFKSKVLDKFFTEKINANIRPIKTGSDILESVESVKKLCIEIMDIIMCLTYLSLIAHLTSANDDRGIVVYGNRIFNHTEGCTYTKHVLYFLNAYKVTDGTAVKCFSSLGVSSILEQDFKPNHLYAQTKKLLIALTKI